MNKVVKEKRSKLEDLDIIFQKAIIDRAIVDYSSHSFWKAVNSAVILSFILYFFVRLGMIEKTFAFLISGNVGVVNYTITLTDVVVGIGLSLAIGLALVSRSRKSSKPKAYKYKPSGNTISTKLSKLTAIF